MHRMLKKVTKTVQDLFWDCSVVFEGVLPHIMQNIWCTVYGIRVEE